MEGKTVVQDFNPVDICWKTHAATSKTSLEFLKVVYDDFLAQKVLYSTQDISLLDLILTDKDE